MNEMGNKTGQHGMAVSGKRGQKALDQQGDCLRKGEIYLMGEWSTDQIIRLCGRSPRLVMPSIEGLMGGRGETYDFLAKPQAKRAWRDRNLCVVGMTPHGYRVFALVELHDYFAERHYLMDAVTGTFYDIRTGECKTSDNERIDHIVAVDDIKPYLKANPDYTHAIYQWSGKTRIGSKKNG